MILGAFSASFFRFFQNVENAPDITFSNSLAALRLSKTIDFWIDFSLNLHVFSDPLPKSIFRWSKCQPIRKSAVLDRFSVFLGSQKRYSEHNFRAKTWKRGCPAIRGNHLGADLGGIWRRNLSKTYLYWSGVVFNRFWKGFGPIWDGLSMIFQWICTPN